MVFLGRSISVHTDSEAFGNSVASLLDANADPASLAPSNYVDRGWKWPPRVAEESFFSYGVFGEPSKSNATARFAGTVISAERRTNETCEGIYRNLRLELAKGRNRSAEYQPASITMSHP